MSPTLAHVLGNPHRETQGYGSCLEPIPRTPSPPQGMSPAGQCQGGSPFSNVALEREASLTCIKTLQHMFPEAGWARPHLGIIQLGSARPRVQMCPDERSKEIGRRAVRGLFGFGRQPATPPL